MPVAESPGITAALSPPVTLIVKYSDTNTVISVPGQKIEKTQAKSAPTLHLPSSLADPAKSYFIMSLDLDAPFPSLPFMSPICHGLWNDMKVDAKAADEGGYKLLEEKEKQLIHWAGPNPPPPSGPHRYTFTVWEQTADVGLMLLGSLNQSH
jgi:phosphatidylethanolamine-binding protein (PEBP) family uncharacterized protein